MSDDKQLLRLLRGPSPLASGLQRLQQYRVGATRYEIRHVPYCDAPVPIHMEDARSPNGYVGVSFDMLAPCRKCEKCLLFRRLKWRDRIAREILLCKFRTWFVTLTFSPIHLAGVASESYAFPNLDYHSAIERAAYVNHVQLYLKRLRKSGARFRFIAVPELGSAHGRLHYHVLFHESLEGCLSKRLLENQWRSFVGAKLVKGEASSAAGYLTKYLTKDLHRPRASLSYGQGPTTKKKSH